MKFYLGICSDSHLEGMYSSPIPPSGTCILSRHFWAAFLFFFSFFEDELFLLGAAKAAKSALWTAVEAALLLVFAISLDFSLLFSDWSDPQSECSEETSVVESADEKSLSSSEQSLVWSSSLPTRTAARACN